MQKLIFTKTLGLNFHQLTINPQPSKALKFNRQLSKSFKNNRQPSKLPHPTYTSKNGGKTPGFGTQLQGSGGGGGPPLIYAIWVCAAPSGRVLCRFGLKTGIHFAHFGLKSGWVFEENSGEYEHFYRFNSK